MEYCSIPICRRQAIHRAEVKRTCQLHAVSIADCDGRRQRTPRTLLPADVRFRPSAGTGAQSAPDSPACARRGTGRGKASQGSTRGAPATPTKPHPPNGRAPSQQSGRGRTPLQPHTRKSVYGRTRASVAPTVSGESESDRPPDCHRLAADWPAVGCRQATGLVQRRRPICKGSGRTRRPPGPERAQRSAPNLLRPSRHLPGLEHASSGRSLRSPVEACS